MTNQVSMMGSGGAPSSSTETTGGLRGLLKQMAQRPLSLAGLVIVLAYLLIALLGPMLAPYHYAHILEDPESCIETASGRIICDSKRSQPPSPSHIFGTDDRGRDVFSRVLWGARDTIGLPGLATLFAISFGTCIGLAIGYAGGWLDEILSRAIDGLLAIPALILALIMLTTLVPTLENAGNPLVRSIGPTNIAIILVIILLYTPIVTRVIRSAVLGVRSSGYVEAARLRGESITYILFREILPSVLPALVVEASLRFSYAIFLVASLGFLGLGVQPPSPEWGRLVLDARSQYGIAPWSLWFPVLAIAVLIVSINLTSDGLRRFFRYEEGKGAA